MRFLVEHNSYVFSVQLGIGGMKNNNGKAMWFRTDSNGPFTDVAIMPKGEQDKGCPQILYRHYIPEDLVAAFGELEELLRCGVGQAIIAVNNH